MKRLILFCALGVFATGVALSQSSSFGIKAGLNFSSLPSTETGSTSDYIISAFSDSYSGYHFGITGLFVFRGGFFQPDFLIRIWHWALTPLTARVMCGWIALLSVGSFVMSADPRWTSWRVPLQSILIWHVLVFAAIAMKADDFTMSLFNWYTVSIFVMVVGILVFYPIMERNRKQLTS